MLKYNLSFFDGGGEKTEQPTARKRHKAREEGQVARSQEIGTAVLFIVVFFALRTFAPSMYANLEALFRFSFVRLSELGLVYDAEYMTSFLTYLFMQAMLVAAPIFALTMVSGVVVNVAQVKWEPTWKPLKPKFSKMNPLSGIKRLFSTQVFMELIKSIFKLIILGYVVYSTFMDEASMLPSLAVMDPFQAFIYIGNVIVDLGIRIGFYYLVIAALDYFYQRYKHNKSLKMTKQEVKEEWKMTEGNPQIKGKIKQKMREASMRRMMQEVPGADVIITNPTHYAVALKYDREVSSNAPIVVAKGVDYLARKIKEKATESGVEIVENKQLARAIYNTVDLGREIPPELYQAVAEILAYIYKLKNKH
ncbi:MAG: flagellar biosynthesis protein FlhB [Clostridiales bacterium]|jgi:flagellar biosynthetic protein FlhB|nr:flagellar biosynthesis protein FlhB [Clostridiales bacterium]